MKTLPPHYSVIIQLKFQPWGQGLFCLYYVSDDEEKFPDGPATSGGAIVFFQDTEILPHIRKLASEEWARCVDTKDDIVTYDVDKYLAAIQNGQRMPAKESDLVPLTKPLYLVPADEGAAEGE